MQLHSPLQRKVYSDIKIDSDIKTAVYETISQFGRIDILFNNAGICAYGLVHELPEEEWDAMIDINLKGAIYMAGADHCFERDPDLLSD